MSIRNFQKFPSEDVSDINMYPIGVSYLKRSLNYSVLPESIFRNILIEEQGTSGEWRFLSRLRIG